MTGFRRPVIRPRCLFRALLYSVRLNGGYWSVMSSAEYAETRSDQRCTPVHFPLDCRVC